MELSPHEQGCHDGVSSRRRYPGSPAFGTATGGVPRWHPTIGERLHKKRGSMSIFLRRLALASQVVPSATASLAVEPMPQPGAGSTFSVTFPELPPTFADLLITMGSSR